jgi:hypothetical protein
MKNYMSLHWAKRLLIIIKTFNDADRLNEHLNLPVMKSAVVSLYLFMVCCECLNAQGRIGINTNTPQAMLHVKDSSVLFSLATLPGVAGNPPASGAGVRMMWYAQKAAFRAGEAGATSWNKDSIGIYSFAAGNSIKAKGVSSFAGGENSEALGRASVALGALNKAIGDYSIVAGYNSVASGNYSLALGRQTEASADYSTVLGYGGTASGLASTSLGYFGTAEGSYSTAIGFSSHAEATMTLATGYDTKASGIVSLSAGYRSESIGSYSMAAGFQTRSLPFASLAIGRYNIDTTGNSTDWEANDPVFMIGDGVDEATRSNSFTVLKNGKTSINLDYPLAALSIKGYDGSENNHIQLIDNNTTESGKIFYSGDLFFKNSRVGGDFFFRNDANTNILSLFSTGSMTITGTLTQSSDARLKKNIVPLQSSLKKVTTLNGYHFNWKDASRDKNLQAGFTAQNVESVMPELVNTTTDGTKSVNYIGVIPYLVEAIKELKEQNTELRKEIEALKKNHPVQ